MIDRTFSHDTILEKSAGGGMDVVYRMGNAKIERAVVVVKVIS